MGKTGFGGKAGTFGGKAGTGGGKAGTGGRPSTGGRPGFGGKPGFGAKPAAGGKPGFGAKPAAGGKPGFGAKPAAGGRPGFGAKPAAGGKGAPTGRGRAGQGSTGGWTGRGNGPAGPRYSRPQQPPAPVGPPVDVHDPTGIRLQKVMAQAGAGSRRVCEDLIVAGRVTVDGHRVSELGVRIDPKRSVVHLDGVRLQLDDSMVYLALNKPLGVLSAMSDPQGRPNLAQFVEDRTERLFHVGRLDADTEGLILLTNDGELANRLTHPSQEVPKVYLVEVAGMVPRDLGRRLREGVELEDGLARVDSFKVVDARPGKALLELVLHDGRNRIVRRLLEASGHPVEQLVRVRVGPIRLGDLRTGRTRVLNKAEVGSLMTAAGL